jgi:hypothetical protein
MALAARVPDDYTGLTFSVHSCTIHGAHLKLQLFYEGDAVYTADLEPADAAAIVQDLTAALALSNAEVAAFVTRNN